MPVPAAWLIGRVAFIYTYQGIQRATKGALTLEPREGPQLYPVIPDYPACYIHYPETSPTGPLFSSIEYISYKYKRHAKKKSETPRRRPSTGRISSLRRLMNDSLL